MPNVLILGAGKIGKAMARLLVESGDYSVTLTDARESVGVVSLDVTDHNALLKTMSGHKYVISALPYFLNPDVAAAAAKAGLHYFDLTEDVKTARAVREISKTSDRVFVPQCGLAPGFISIVAHGLVARFEDVMDVHLRVGALPQFPDNALKYNLTWSTDGLINEYCNPCESIYDGKRREVLALEGLEHFTLDGVRYEVFNTSGGIGSLCETLEGHVQNLNYKTVRYPGHRDLMQMMCKDLRLCERRNTFRDIVEHGIPVTHQDVVLIFVTVRGTRNDRLEQESYVKKIYSDESTKGFSAIQKTTAAGLCALLDMHKNGDIAPSGFVKPEEISLEAFLNNRFGSVYA
jgi:saccharopine dehydrogenase-like NADP-dependent oxidoreductase